MRFRFAVGLFTMFVVGASALGETPLGPGFTFQGQLKEAGVPLDGTVDFLLTLWDAAGSGDPPTGGVRIGDVEEIRAVTVTAGLFTVLVNAHDEFRGGAFDGNTRWLQVEVSSPAGGDRFTALAPRQRLTPAPYAFTALRTVGVDGHSLDAADGAPTDALFVDNAGRVGIGTTSPDNTLHVHKGSSGVVTGYFNAPLVVENSTNAYINLLSPDATERGLLFGSPSSGTTSGGIIYNAAATLEGFQIRTGGNVNRMVIDSSGDVGIGTTGPAAKLDVRGNVKLGPGGQYFAPGGEENLRIVRGVIAAAGGILAGSGFQVSRPFTGGYDIAFDTSFSGLPAVTASANLLNGTFPFVSVVTVSATQVRFVVRTETGLNSDRDVYFIAIGPR